MSRGGRNVSAAMPARPPSMRRRRRLVTAFSALAVSALMCAACGGGTAAESTAEVTVAQSPDDAVEASDAAVEVVRLAMPTEPLWQWLVDSGALAEWEQRNGVRVEASHPFRPFTAFVSGHADIILVDALNIPVFTAETGGSPLIIGKYSSDRSLAAAKRTSSATDLAGEVEGRIAVESSMGSTLLWALIVEQAHGLELREDSQDFEFFTATFGLADAVTSGDAEACICQPEQSAGGLSEGMLRPLYEGASATELYTELSGVSEPLIGQVFLTSSEWYERNKATAGRFLELWDDALRHWHGSYAEVIAQYPELLSVQSDREIAWLAAYVAEHNWMASSVHLSAADADLYHSALDQLRARGLIEPDAPTPWVVTARPSADQQES